MAAIEIEPKSNFDSLAASAPLERGDSIFSTVAGALASGFGMPKTITITTARTNRPAARAILFFHKPASAATADAGALLREPRPPRVAEPAALFRGTLDLTVADFVMGLPSRQEFGLE
ncbi:MAG: hypothetical protein HYU75_08935 [Betaproteobacteria bacterium]|nr:hypothetical protein [Betaproteobacteria bacterium]